MKILLQKKFMIFFIILLTLFFPFEKKLLAEELFNFTILHTNDEHSSLIPHSPAVDYQAEVLDSEEDLTLGGFSRLATAVKEIKAEKEAKNEDVLLLSGGDFLSGSPFAWLALRDEAAELKLMQEIGYDAVVIGNHEFDYGTEILSNYFKKASYPEAHQKTSLLGSNFYIPDNEKYLSQDFIKESKIIELDNGLKIGLFGVMGDDAVSVIKDSGQIEFLDIYETAARISTQLKEKGADIIIALSHSGINDEIRLAENNSQIDLIIGGHSHSLISKPLKFNNTFVVQAGSKLNYLGFLEFTYNRENEELIIKNLEQGNTLIELNSEVESDPEIKELVAEYKDILNNYLGELTAEEFNSVLETVARSDFKIKRDPPLSETGAGNFITDAVRIIADEHRDKKIDVVAKTNGSIRKNIIPGQNGDISFYEIAETVGLGMGKDQKPGYSVISGYLSGREVKELLEAAVLAKKLMGNSAFLQFSGLRYDYDINKVILTTIPIINQPVPSLAAVENIKIYKGTGIQSKNPDDYKPLEKDKLYHFAADSYLLDNLKMINDLVPEINIIPKKLNGEKVSLDNPEELLILKENGEQLKIWETVVNYAASNNNGEEEAFIPEYYSESSDRINSTQMKREAPKIYGSYLKNNLRDNPAENINLDLSNLRGYKVGVEFNLSPLYGLNLEYNNLRSKDSGLTAEEIEIKGIKANLNYKLHKIIAAAGYNTPFKINLKAGGGIYGGEQKIEKESYSLKNNIGFNLGLELKKDLSSNLAFKADIDYRFLELDLFLNQIDSQSKNLSGWNYSLGFSYQF